MTPNPAQTDEQRKANGRASIANRVQEVVADCIHRRNRGERVSDESLCAAHPDLMPDVAQALRHLRLVEIACDEPRSAADRDSLTPRAAADSTGAAGSSRHLRVRCPHCHQPQEVVVESSLADIGCSSCGNRFSLVGEPEQAGQPPAALGHFQLVEKLGVGGFGSVWKAWDAELDRLVAIKVPRRGQLTPSEAEQFLREARAAAQLRHPHIVSVHEVGRDGDTVYIVSDYVEGETLAARLARERMTAAEAAELCQNLAGALHHAHEQGIVHRDLKPANILLDDEGQPHITDFGLARREIGETTMTFDGQLVGTPAYMSPEQARGDSHLADRRSDVYSLGVILYELLAGEPPFRGSVSLLTQQILHEEAPSPRRLNASLPRDLETICLKCLEKDPARRYTTALDLADDLARFRRREPIHARPVSKPERLWRWCRRRPVVAGLTATVAILLIAIAAVTTYSSIRSQAAAKEARWQQYLSDMHVAMQAWDDGDVGRAIEALDRHRPAAGDEDLRRFEWYYLWRQCQGTCQTSILKHDGRVVAIALSPDGKLLAVAKDAYTVDVWHLPTNKKLHTLTGHVDFVKGVAFSPDGRTLASASIDRTIRLWDTATGAPRHTIDAQKGFIRNWGVVFSPDGKLLGSPSSEHVVRLWDAATGALLHVFSADLPEAEFRQVAFSPDGTLLAASCTDQTTKLWKISDRTLVRSFTGHVKAVGGVAFSPDGAMLATSSADQTVKLWNVVDGAMLRSLSGHSSAVWAVAFTPDGARIASAGDDGTVRLWDAATGTQLEVLRGHSGTVYAAIFSRDGKQLVTGGVDATVRFWDAGTAHEENILRAHAISRGRSDAV